MNTDEQLAQDIEAAAEMLEQSKLPQWTQSLLSYGLALIAEAHSLPTDVADDDHELYFHYLEQRGNRPTWQRGGA